MPAITRVVLCWAPGRFGTDLQILVYNVLGVMPESEHVAGDKAIRAPYLRVEFKPGQREPLELSGARAKVRAELEKLREQLS